MSRYIMIRRLRGPAFLLLVGVLALLNQADILTWGQSWPFFLILAGLLKLAERAALASEGGYPPFPGSPYPGTPDFRAAANIPPYPGQPEPYISPDKQQEYNKDSMGGQL
ncbi:MAG: LiaF transmembrane domain-containing protein [Terracidiphilus sp.]